MGWLSDTWDSVTDAAGDFVDEVEESWEDIQDAGEDFAEDVQDTWSDAFSGVQEALREESFLEAAVADVGGIVAGDIGTVGNAVALAFSVGGAVVAGVIGVAGVVVGGLLRTAITFLSGGTISGFAKNLGRWITELCDGLGDLVSDVFAYFGTFIERLFDIAAGLVLGIATKVRCAIRGNKNFFGSVAPEPRGIDLVDHFFVLMLENRSFDHMLGLMRNLRVERIDPQSHYNLTGAGARIPAGADAKLSLGADPPHEFAQVDVQLHGGPTHPNGGFIEAFEAHMGAEHPEEPEEVMRAFSPNRLPILHALAEEFAVCDHWFSSLPGPTLPNRLFAHAATSGGLADSPSKRGLIWSMTLGGFEFDKGTIFDRLTTECRSWRIYAGDFTPLVMALKGIATEDVLNGWGAVRKMHAFRGDLMASGPDFPQYIFIEPDYGRFWSDFKRGNSQHPLDSVVGGEELIKLVYEALRASPIWERSALIITYDEHGGFYDHIVPLPAQPPGDRRHYAGWADDPAARAFQFDRYGVRVPAVVVSPLIPRGTVDHTVYDHASIIATLTDRFGLPPMTERSRRANSLVGLFTLDEAREDTPLALPEVYTE